MTLTHLLSTLFRRGVDYFYNMHDVNNFSVANEFQTQNSK